jgi:hypothetical protein
MPQFMRRYIDCSHLRLHRSIYIQAKSDTKAHALIDRWHCHQHIKGLGLVLGWSIDYQHRPNLSGSISNSRLLR